MMCLSGARLLAGTLAAGLLSAVVTAQQPSSRSPVSIPPSVSSQPAPPAGPPWWKDEQFKKDLGLTNEQSVRIEAIFQVAFPQLKQGYDELDRVENKLSHLIEINAEEAMVVKQIDRVEATRANLHKTRTLMHLHMRQVLTQEQRLRFTALFDQRERRQAEQRQQAQPLRHSEE